MKKVLAAVAVAMTLPMTVMAWEPTGDVNVIVAYKVAITVRPVDCTSLSIII